MKMKNTTISNHCKSTDPLSTAISTENSVTSELNKNVENKKKKTFFSKVKTIFSKSSTEAHKNVPAPLHKAVKNTYVVRENQGTCGNDLQIYRDLNDEVNYENCELHYGANVNFTQNQRIDDVFVKDLVNKTKENMDSVDKTGKNNGSWITTSTNSIQDTKTNSRDIFTNQTTLSSSLVDVGVQTKIPSCYKVYLLHKHVSNCNRRNKSNSKIKKKIITNSDKHKRPVSCKSYYYNKYSSTQSISTDESDGYEIMRRKLNTKYRKENKTKNNKNIFPGSTRYYETNNIDIELLESTDRLPRHNKILNIDSNCNIIINNDDRTTFSGIHVSSSNSNFFDSTESKKSKYQRVNNKNTEIQTNKPYKQEETNAEGSQSKSLPSLNLLRKNRSINEVKCISSPLVSQNTILTKILKKKKSAKTIFFKGSRNNKEIKNPVLKPFRNFHRKKYKDIKETHKKSLDETTSLHCEEVSSFWSKNSNVDNKIKEEIDNIVKINKKRKQISEKSKINKLKSRHINSNSSIMKDMWQIKSSVIKNDLNAMKIDTNIKHVCQNDKTRTKQKQTYYQNDHFIHENSDNIHQSFSATYNQNDENNMKIYDQNDLNINTDSLNLNRRPIITQPMIFFNENVKSKTENCMSNCFLNKTFSKKEKEVRDVNMKLIKKRQPINSQNDFKTPSEQQNLNPYQMNYNEPEMMSKQFFMDNVTTHRPKKKCKNQKNNEIENFISPLLAVNKQKFANINKKNVNNPMYKETNSYDCIKKNHEKKNNTRYSKNSRPNCNSQLGTSGKAFDKKNKNNYTSWKPSSEILKRSNLTEISFECNIKSNIFHKNKQVNKKTQKNWNENLSCSNKSNSDKKFNKNSKSFNQEMKMFYNIEAEKMLLKQFSPDVGVHGAFSGNITSKRKTFFAKITPMHINK